MEIMSDAHEKSSRIENSFADTGCVIGVGAIIRNGVKLGKNCVVGDYTILDGAVTVGDSVTIASHCSLRGPATLEAGVQLGPNTSISSSNDEPVTIRHSAIVGAHSTIAGPLVIAERAVIDPGSVVTRNVPANVVVAGNPAKIVRYQHSPSAIARHLEHAAPGTIVPSAVRGVSTHHLPMIEDLRGNLSFGEAQRHVPFEIKRYFLTFDVVSEEARGEHAHGSLQQFLICVHGRVNIVADDGRSWEEIVLDRPNVAVYLPPMVWGLQYRFTADAVLLVLCSEPYDPAGYIRSYAEFLELVKREPGVPPQPEMRGALRG
jgi:acetyltransferase-like isoleucine patch superfamily enzyme/dTDP-4-dehydrorhamnose 3,5-epimerase-like enzyme